MTVRSSSSFAAAALACLGFAAPGAAASAAPENKIKVVVPAKVKTGSRFLASADAQFDKRVHKPPYDWLNAGLFSKRGTTTCPQDVPIDGRGRERRGWDTVVDYEFMSDPADVHTEFGTSIALKKAGRYRFCAYIYVSTPSRKVGSFTETHHTRARASKLVRAQAG